MPAGRKSSTDSSTRATCICIASRSLDQILDEGKIFSKCHFEVLIIPTTQSCGGGSGGQVLICIPLWMQLATEKTNRSC